MALAGHPAQVLLLRLLPPPTATKASPTARTRHARTAGAASVLVAFVASGMIHEYMCWAAMGVAPGGQLLFFTLHGVAAVAERALMNRAHTRASHRVGTALFCILTCPLFAWPLAVTGHVYQFPSFLPALAGRWAGAGGGSAGVPLV